MPQKTTSLKYPLSGIPSTGIDNLKRLNLSVEVGGSLDTEDIKLFADIAISGHAPKHVDDLLMNIATPEDDFREESIEALLRYIDMARGFPKLEQVNIHPPLKRWVDEAQTRGANGEYDLLIDSCRRLADYAASIGIEIVLENYIASWGDVPDDVPADEIDWSSRNEAFGVTPGEWIQICEDVARPNFALCLDSSHASTYAHTIADVERREEAVMAFVAKPDLIHHVHWSDNYLYDARGREDSHALIGKGSLPVELHRAIKELDATILIEHFYGIEELEQELEYIEAL